MREIPTGRHPLEKALFSASDSKVSKPPQFKGVNIDLDEILNSMNTDIPKLRDLRTKSDLRNVAVQMLSHLRGYEQVNADLQREASSLMQVVVKQQEVIEDLELELVNIKADLSQTQQLIEEDSFNECANSSGD